MKWRKTGAALLVTTFTVTSAGYALANDQLFDTVDLSKLNHKPVNSTVVTTVSEKPVTPSTTKGKAIVTNQTNNLQENGLPKIPVDYPSGNLKGLYKAYEKTKNPKEKEAIKLKIEYLIAKYEIEKKYKNDNDKKYTKNHKEQKEKVKELRKEQKEKEKELQKEQKEQRKELKEKEKEIHKAEKHHNQKNKDNNDKD